MTAATIEGLHPYRGGLQRRHILHGTLLQLRLGSAHAVCPPALLRLRGMLLQAGDEFQERQ